MRKSADVVIIGGGIQGTSVAYHLAKMGITDVVLVEMNTLGSGSSGATAAMLMHQTGQELTTKLAKLSIKEYLSYPDELSIDIGFHPIGSICFATEEAAERLRRRIEMQNRLGVPTEILDGTSVNKLAPRVNPEGILIGAYCPQDGFVDPYGVLHAYAGEARRRGIEINMRTRALGIKTHKGQVEGVITNEGIIETGKVVNAAGALASQVGKWVDIELPLTNYRRNIVLLAPRPPLEEFPIVEDIVTEWYFRPEGRNIMVGVGPQTRVGDVPDSLQPPFEDGCLVELGQYINVHAPKLADAGVTRMKWAGIRDITPDELPILGPVEELSGFLNCCGWSGFGVTLAPVTGQLIAELITDGKTTTADITPFLLARFRSK